MNKQAAIIIMCKAPTAGAVKTRLAPFLSEKQAAEFATCLARDAAEKAQAICKNIIIAFAPENGKDLLETILPRDLMWTTQKGNDLGERMHNALCFASAQKFSPLVVIGTDSPTLPPEFIRQAMAVLSENRADVVLGKSEDGGYYTIAVNQPNSAIFETVEWSSQRAFEQTARNVDRLNLRLHVLPIWYDVHWPQDL